MPTPPPALDALLAPAPLTLGQAALLEKINSPLLVEHSTLPAALDLLPSLYLLSLTAPEALEHLPTLQHDAIAWADTLTPQAYQAALQAAAQAIQAFYELLPKPEANAKKASPATAG